MRHRGVELVAQTGRVILKLNKLIMGAVAFSMANVALAGLAPPPVVPLGGALGISLGNALGAALGLQLGSALPIEIGGLLTVAAVSLVLGIRIVRRKQNR